MPEPGDVICDRHRRDWYVITAVEDGAIELRDEGTEYRIPRSLFVSVYGKRLFDGGRTASLDPPEWCTTG